MAQRVGAGRSPLDALLRRVGRLATPALRALSRASILPAEGLQSLPGLQAPVEVHFDEHGIPHIRARTDADAFRAQGYCHARDRFFQMDMMRRVLRGGLSEVVGERPLGALALPPFGKEGTTVDADRLMRVLDLGRAAQRVWRVGSAEGRALLTAYVGGVNAAIERMRRRVPLEHRLLKLRLEAWRPVDSILMAKGMALGLAFKWRAAPVFAAIAEHLRDDPERLASLLPPVPGRGAFAIAHCLAEGLGDVLDFVPGAPPSGSNAWMVAGGRTRSGKPIVASDPHLELSLPAIWHLGSLHGPRYQAVGCALPGLPGVVIGRTPSLAWGLTNAMLDDCDLWVEDVDEAGRRYRVDGAWRPLERDTQELHRRGDVPLVVRIRRTHRGPLFTDAFPSYAGPPLSIRLALHEPTADMEAFLGLGRSRSVEEALEALAPYGAPAQNLLIADAAGRSAYQLIGRVPRRSLEQHPALPRDGATSASDWQGFAHGHAVPHFDLGPQDQVVSANHPPAEGSYPLYLSHLYEPDYRAERITSQLADRDDLTLADMMRLQSDAVNASVPRFRRVILEPHVAGVRAARPTLGSLLDQLLAWDGDEHVDARGGVAWHLLYHHLVRRTFGPKLGEELLGHWMGVINLIDPALYAAFGSEASPWAPPQARTTLLLDALEDTVRDLQARGLPPDAPWGAFHTLHLKHPVGGAAPLADAWNRGPYPADGGPYSIVSGQYLHSRPGPVIAGQSYRQVVDLADPRGGRMVTFGGQSGHIGSPHYDDLTPLWRAYGGVPMRLEDLPPRATVLRLEPR